MNRLLTSIGVAVVMLVGLGACTPAGNIPVNLLLAGDKPTFLFFYTAT